jgi:hypothetical protein
MKHLLSLAVLAAGVSLLAACKDERMAGDDSLRDAQEARNYSTPMPGVTPDPNLIPPQAPTTPEDNAVPSPIPGRTDQAPGPEIPRVPGAPPPPLPETPLQN